MRIPICKVSYRPSKSQGSENAWLFDKITHAAPRWRRFLASKVRITRIYLSSHASHAMCRVYLVFYIAERFVCIVFKAWLTGRGARRDVSLFHAAVEPPSRSCLK